MDRGTEKLNNTFPKLGSYGTLFQKSNVTLKGSKHSKHWMNNNSHKTRPKTHKEKLTSLTL